MTAEFREVVPCPECGMAVSTEQPIKAWIRGHDQLDSRRACLCIGDSDLWIHKYGTRSTRWRGVRRDVQYLMLVEIKTHDADMTSAQRDLMWTVDQLLRSVSRSEQRAVGRFLAGHRKNVRMVHSLIAGRTVAVYCYGVHKLRLSGSTPADSDRITWDNKPIGAEQVAEVLRFDLNPDTLRPMEHRSHKKTVDMPSLFDADEETA